MRAPVCKATTEFCYRLNKGEFANQLAKILARYPKYQCEGPTAVSPELKLASALRWLAGGAYVDARQVLLPRRHLLAEMPLPLSQGVQLLHQATQISAFPRIRSARRMMATAAIRRQIIQDYFTNSPPNTCMASDKNELQCKTLSGLKASPTPKRVHAKKLRSANFPQIRQKRN